MHCSDARPSTFSRYDTASDKTSTDIREGIPDSLTRDEFDRLRKKLRVEEIIVSDKSETSVAMARGGENVRARLKGAEESDCRCEHTNPF